MGFSGGQEHLNLEEASGGAAADEGEEGPVPDRGLLAHSVGKTLSGVEEIEEMGLLCKELRFEAFVAVDIARECAGIGGTQAPVHRVEGEEAFLENLVLSFDSELLPNGDFATPLSRVTEILGLPGTGQALVEDELVEQGPGEPGQYQREQTLPMEEIPAREGQGEQAEKEGNEP